MTEPAVPTSPDVPVSEKRAWLKANGYNVGARGKLSVDHEDAFLRKVPAEQHVQNTVDAEERGDSVE
jgi:hypothetical protein